jgi:hypothetical protein
MTILRVMFTLEMVLDEFPYVAFMWQDTISFLRAFGLVTESGEISEVFRLHHVQSEARFQNNICIRLKNQVHVIYDS